MVQNSSAGMTWDYPKLEGIHKDPRVQLCGWRMTEGDRLSIKAENQLCSPTFRHSQKSTKNDGEHIPPTAGCCQLPPQRGFFTPPQATLTESCATAGQGRVRRRGGRRRRSRRCHGAEGGRGALECPHAEGRRASLHRLGCHLLLREEKHGRGRGGMEEEGMDSSAQGGVGG